MINKSNTKQQVLRFLKLYDELCKCLDEEVKIKLNSEVNQKYNSSSSRRIS